MSNDIETWRDVQDCVEDGAELEDVIEILLDQNKENKAKLRSALKTIKALETKTARPHRTLYGEGAKLLAVMLPRDVAEAFASATEPGDTYDMLDSRDFSEATKACRKALEEDDG